MIKSNKLETQAVQVGRPTKQEIYSKLVKKILARTIVRSTRPSYEYHAPLRYVEPIAKLVDTPPLKEACSPSGEAF